ncbi:hypothetical protein DFP72DRAFT_229186 [Ephemerocybe angulata]|uniref:F-box domain-containing protein n=1 Tax=Ephemerocybe angulata TaxID=980116 RepID=A0A8H6LUZ2_9AGAR|nr:hypothetical protein DFP72DRAFT_229186 [Tulosesus angulatus]
MHQCLRIPEVVRNICDCLAQSHLLSVALTSRTLLESALDSIWESIITFDPIIACLPADLWRKDEVEGPSGDSYTSLFLRRPIEDKDLTRYLTRYAGRIRDIGFTFQPGDRILALEGFQGLQLATRSRPGALSPNLKSFKWLSPTPLQELAGVDFSRQLSPYMSLFMGESVVSLSSGGQAGNPLHIAVIRSTIERLPRLKSLDVADSTEAPLKDYYLEQYTYMAHLQHLTMNSLSPEAVSRIALLPSLRSLRVFDNRSNEVHSAIQETLARGPRITGGFCSLRTIVVISYRPTSVITLLPSLPHTNIVESITCSHPTTSTEEWQEVVDVIGTYCNPGTLESLCIDGYGMGPIEREALDMKPHPEVKITALTKFKKLAKLKLCFEGGVQVRAEDIPAIRDAWPEMCSLDLLPTEGCRSRMPVINHTHVLEILKGCPNLNLLALRFDTTQLTDEEAEADCQFDLGTLCVGASPICSPSIVAKFIRSYFPELRILGVYYPGRLGDTATKGRPMMDKRWSAVVKELEL